MNDAQFGRYRLIEQLGRGGMGEVWRAHDTAIGRTVAIKMLLPHFAKDEKYEQRFRREARAAARLDNPHVVPMYDVGEIDGRLYVSMRLINGQDLHTVIGAGPLEPRRAVAIIEQVAKALDAAHRVGLIHRDIKPSNILVGEDDFAYLIDFGIARAEGETGLTSTGATIGTWSYMAPERFTTGRAGARSDIYALACVLCECLTGEHPFPAVALEQIVAAHMLEPPPRPSQLRPGMPTAIDEVIATGMAKDPQERYATSRELAGAARAALDPTTEAPQPAVTPVDAVARPPITPPFSQLTTAPKADAPTAYAAPGGPTQPASPGPTLPRQPAPTTRLSQGAKTAIAVGAVAAVAVVVAIVVAISTTTQQASPSAERQTTPTAPEPTQTNPPPATASAPTSTARQRWDADHQPIVDAFPTLLSAAPQGKGFGDITCFASNAPKDPETPEVACSNYDSSTAEYSIRCNKSGAPMTSDPFRTIAAEHLVSSQPWTKPSGGSGQVDRYEDPYGWRKLHIRFNGTRSFCRMHVSGTPSVVDQWWSAVPL